jgi:hypothetical protein
VHVQFQVCLFTNSFSTFFYLLSTLIHRAKSGSAHTTSGLSFFLSHIAPSLYCISYLLNPEGHVRLCTYNFRSVFLSISCSTFSTSYLPQSRGLCATVHNAHTSSGLSFFLSHVATLSLSAPFPIFLNPKSHVWQCADIFWFIYLFLSLSPFLSLLLRQMPREP